VGGDKGKLREHRRLGTRVESGEEVEVGSEKAGEEKGEGAR